jgi:hypothetical protein
MGNPVEQKMWEWLEKNRPEAEQRYVAEVRATVNDLTIPCFFEWCMENFQESEK